MRTVGMGVAPENEDQELYAENAAQKAENAALRQEITELRAKKSNKKGKDDLAEEPVTE